MSPRRVAILLIAANMVAAPLAFAQSRSGGGASQNDEEDDTGDEEEEPAATPRTTSTTSTTTTTSNTQASSTTTTTTTTTAASDFPEHETDVEAEARRERMLARFPSLDGAIGLLHMATPDSGSDQTFRFSFIGEYAGFGNFLRPTMGNTDHPRTVIPDNSQHIGATLGLSYTPVRYVEIHAALRSYANYADTSTPHLFQVLGDTTLGVKAFYPIHRAFRVGLDASLLLLNRAGGIGVFGAGTSANFRLLAALDLQQISNSVPIRISLNAGYLLDNSGQLVTDVEQARQRADNRYDPAACGMPADTDPTSARNRNPACHIEITREERYALGINRADRFNISLGIDANLPWVRPFIEWNVSVPVVRNGYICYGTTTTPMGSPTLSPDDDRCLAQPGLNSFAASPSVFTIGARVAPPPIRGLSALLAFDIATGGSSLFVRELAPTAPWTFYFGAAYAHDFAPQIRRVEVPREVVREVRVDNTPVHGRLVGNITDAETHQPVAGAVIDIVGHPDFGYVASGPQGHYTTLNLAPANYQIHVRAQDYNENTCNGVIPAPTGDAREVPDVTLDCALRPVPRMGNIGGHVLTATGTPANHLTVSLTPTQVTPPAGVAAPQAQTATTGADGTYQFQNLPAGLYNVSAGQGTTPPTRASTPRSIEVRPRETANGDITVQAADTTGITVARGAINVREQVHFQTDSAEILPDSSTLLERIADVINRHPEIGRIEIQGHTDNQGNAPHNMTLSQSRAESVRARLVELGVTADRLTAHGFGQTRPIAPNLTAAGRARNRRVMFVITQRTPAAAAH